MLLPKGLELRERRCIRRVYELTLTFFVFSFLVKCLTCFSRIFLANIFPKDMHHIISTPWLYKRIPWRLYLLLQYELVSLNISISIEMFQRKEKGRVSWLARRLGVSSWNIPPQLREIRNMNIHTCTSSYTNTHYSTMDSIRLSGLGIIGSNGTVWRIMKL